MPYRARWTSLLDSKGTLDQAIAVLGSDAALRHSAAYLSRLPPAVAAAYCLVQDQPHPHLSHPGVHYQLLQDRLPLLGPQQRNQARHHRAELFQPAIIGGRDFCSWWETERMTEHGDINK